MKFHTAARKAQWRVVNAKSNATAREIGMCLWCWKYPVETKPDGTRRLGCTVCYATRAIQAMHRRAAKKAQAERSTLCKGFGEVLGSRKA